MTTLAPPRRKPVPLAVQVQVLLRQLGLKGKKIDWSHEPALGLRAILPDGSDYDPPQLDPDYIFAREAAVHDQITFKNNGTGRGDLTAIAHVRRGAEQHQQHLDKMAAKAEGREVETPRSRLRGRGFPKGHRPLRSRNHLRRRKP